jgi:hypothetical protein
MIGYEQKLARVLDAMGGLFTLNDILERVHDGRMQSFAVNNTVAFTEIQVFPRARKLHVVALVGDLADGEAMHAKILDYASSINAGLVSAYGRRGWLDLAREHGWRLIAKGNLYQKSM